MTTRTKTPVNRAFTFACALNMLATPALAATETTPSVSLGGLLKASRGKGTLADLSTRIKELSEAKTVVSTKPDSVYFLEVEGAQAQSAPDGEERDRSGSILLGRTFRFGLDDEAAARQAKAEAEAVGAELESTFQDQDMDVAELFVELCHEQRLAIASRDILKPLDPLLSQADLAAARGTASSLASLKWRLLHEKLKAANTSARSKFAALVALINSTLGTSLPDDPYKLRLEPIAPPTVKDKQVIEEAPEVRASLAAEEALRSGASAIDGSLSIDAAVGVERDFRGETNSVLFKLSVPLDQGSVNNATSRAMLAESALAGQRAQAVRRRLTQRLAVLEGQLKANAADVATLEHYKQDVQKINETSLSGLRRGLTEFSEVVESFEGLFEANIQLAEAQRAFDENAAEISILAGVHHE